MPWSEPKIKPCDWDAPDPHPFDSGGSRVAKNATGDLYVWMWSRGGVGYVKARDESHVNELLAQPPYEGVGR